MRPSILFRNAALALLVSALTLTMAAHRTACAGSIHALGDASTSTFTHGSIHGDTARGWEFQVNAANVQVLQLGVNAWTDNTLLTLSLWNDNTQSLLAQTTATSSASNWVFSNLGSPVTLTSGVSYSVIGWANVSTAWYQFNNSPPAVFMPTGTIQYIQTRFDNGTGANAYPSQILVGQYGVTDIGYQITPEPSSLVLAALGFIGIAWRLRRL
jgi:hypothetical protein